MTKSQLEKENAGLRRKLRELELSHKRRHTGFIEALQRGTFGSDTNFGSGVYVTLETLSGKHVESVLIRDGIDSAMIQETINNAKRSQALCGI